MLLLENKAGSLHLEGYTTILPCIGFGNVGQLACDLIISTLQLKRVATILHPALVPIYGPSPFQHDKSKAASCELYADETKKLLVIQLRSRVISKHPGGDFYKELVEILKKCSKVIILTSSFGYEKHTVEGNFFEYLANDQFKRDKLKQLNAQRWTEFGGKVIHGGGSALKMYKILSDNNVPVLLLFKYILEGDNSPDAAELVRELDELCESELMMRSSGELKLKMPSSWKLLYGNEAPIQIF